VSNATVDIVLPPQLVPADGRFGSGPSKVRQQAVEALSAVAPTYLGTSHRRDGVRSIVARARAGIAELFGLPAGYEVLLGNGGSTLFWDAAAFGLVEQQASHLVLGEFSSKFAATTKAAPHLDAPEVLESEPGAVPSTLDAPRGDAYAYPHNETSTGVTIPVHRPAAGNGDALVLVDATSAAGGTPFDPSLTDVYYFAPQKCFASDGGLWLGCFSPRAVERIERIAASGRWTPASLDLGIALENSRLEQTYNTPALATLFLLAHQVEWMLDNGGMAFSTGRCAASAQELYDWAEQRPWATPFVKDPSYRSVVSATIDFEAPVDAAAIASTLRANGIVDVEPYRKLGRNQLRIGVFPAIETDDVVTLTRAIDYIVERLGTAR
jgi:phosphoserine aminotransferase